VRELGDRRRAERERLLDLGREYVEMLTRRLPVRGAAVAGSVARGDFNAWSDVDVVVVADDLPARALDRAELLLRDAPPGVQPVGYTPAEFERACERGDRLAREAVERGVLLVGELAAAARRRGP
jgi:predicted nucleotidyltransferase